MSRFNRIVFLIAVVGLLAVPSMVAASHTFDDVDDSNTFHNQISWLADADVTKGCNPPTNTNFCPGANVTRGQMAAFMNRFADYLGATDGVVSEADDAATVAGFTPPQMGSVAGNSITLNPEVLNSFDNVAIEQVSINAPVDGYLMIEANSSYRDTDDSQILQWLQLDDDTCVNGPPGTTSIDFSYGSTTSASPWSTVANGGVIAATAGDHTVTLCAREFSSNGDPQYYSPTIQVMFSPFGSIVSGLESAPAADGVQSFPGMAN